MFPKIYDELVLELPDERGEGGWCIGGCECGWSLISQMTMFKVSNKFTPSRYVRKLCYLYKLYALFDDLIPHPNMVLDYIIHEVQSFINARPTFLAGIYLHKIVNW